MNENSPVKSPFSPDSPIRLTQYSRGAGCGCKIAPKVLHDILQSNVKYPEITNLLVGNSTNDDAAVYDIGNGQVIISTTDFFMPVVDDPYDFGRIAAANAISDVYAMGGSPLMAVAILGWPVELLPVALAAKVLEGARAICAEAGIPLAGGHSIDTTEPMFGLVVTGMANRNNIKQNNSAGEGDLLFLTRPIGSGILATAQKRGVLKPEHEAILIGQLTTLNKVGMQLGMLKEVTAMTDVTGFGILGHLIEMATSARLSAEIFYSKVPVMEGVRSYMAEKVIPDATYRNWNSYSAVTGFEKGVNVMEAFNLLPDPQTNGGLLFTVKEDAADNITALLAKNGMAQFAQPIGRMVSKQEKTVMVKI